MKPSSIRPTDCPGITCENRNVSHLHCTPRRCIGRECSNMTGRYCHAHNQWCSPSTCSCTPRDCLDTSNIDPSGLYCHVHYAFCDTPHCQCGKRDSQTDS